MHTQTYIYTYMHCIAWHCTACHALHACYQKVLSPAAQVWRLLMNLTFGAKLRSFAPQEACRELQGGPGARRAWARRQRARGRSPWVVCVPLKGSGGQNRFGIPFWLVGEFTTHFCL